MSNNETKISEQSRFVLLNNVIASEVKIGKTIFEISSNLSNDNNSFESVVARIAEHQIDQISKSAG